MTGSDVPLGSGPSKASDWGWMWVALIPAILLTIFQNLLPEVTNNEPVRLTSLEQVFHPGFLSHEWLHLAGYNEDSLTFGFKILFAPIWFAGGQGIWAAMLCRVVAWAILFYALARLARALEISGVALAIGCLYFVGHQTQGAN